MIVLHRDLEDNFGFYKRERREVAKKIIFGLIGMVVMFSIWALSFPNITGPIINGIKLISMLLFLIFFMYLIWAYSHRPSAEKRIFANFYQSLKYLDFYKKERRENDLKKVKKYLRKALNLIKNAPSTELKMVDEKVETEINLPLGKLADDIDSRLIPSTSSNQIDKKLQKSYNIIERLALGFYAENLDKIKKIDAVIKNKLPRIRRRAPEKGFATAIRSITKTSAGLVLISVGLGYILVLLIASLLSVLFGWEMSDPVIGSAMIGGGGAISYMIFTAAKVSK